MAVEYSGNHPKLLWPGVKALFGVGYATNGEQFRDLFSVESSKQAWEEDVLLSGYPLLNVKPEGTSTQYASRTQGYIARYTHIAYSLGFIVTYEELQDNLYEKHASARAKFLGMSKSQTKNTVAANVYNRAFTSTYAGGDGKELCATDHPTKSGSQSNELATAADLSEASLEDLMIQIMTAKDDIGNNISLRGKTLIIPPAGYFEATRILESVNQNWSANNATNALRATGMLPGGIKVNDFLTDTDAFFVRTMCMDGMKLYQRDGFDLKKDNDFDTDNAKAKTYDRYSVGWSDWRDVFGSPGA